MLKKSVTMGIRKVNITTEYAAHADALKRALAGVWSANARDMRKASQAAVDAVRAVAVSKIRMFCY